MGSRYIVKWYDITALGYRVAIMEPIVAETAEDNDILKTEEPSKDDGTENNVVPSTGDESNLLVLFFAITTSDDLTQKSKLRQLVDSNLSIC